MRYLNVGPCPNFYLVWEKWSSELLYYKDKNAAPTLSICLSLNSCRHCWVHICMGCMRLDTWDQSTAGRGKVAMLPGESPSPLWLKIQIRGGKMIICLIFSPIKFLKSLRCWRYCKLKHLLFLLYLLKFLCKIYLAICRMICKMGKFFIFFRQAEVMLQNVLCFQISKHVKNDTLSCLKWCNLTTKS